MRLPQCNTDFKNHIKVLFAQLRLKKYFVFKQAYMNSATAREFDFVNQNNPIFNINMKALCVVFFALITVTVSMELNCVKVS